MLQRLRDLGSGPLFDAVLKHVPIGVTIADAPDVMILKVSDSGVELLQRPRDALEGIPVDKHVDAFKVLRLSGEVALAEELPLTRAVQKGEVVRNEEWIVVTEDGRRIPILCNAGPILDENGNILGGIIAWADLTKQKELEDKLRRALEEKEALFNELMHRSSNNFQAIISIIDLNRKVPDITIDKFAKDLKDRIGTFSIIQESLYSLKGAEWISAFELIDAICSAYKTNLLNIFISADAGILISRKQAAPLGIIVNEVVCNCLKHAFDADEQGSIEVRVSIAGDELEVSIADDGKGFKETEGRGSLGLRLLRTFAAQLNGSSSYSGRVGGGTVFTLRFPLDED